MNGTANSVKEEKNMPAGNTESGLDMTVNLAGVELKNPVMTASGTFGSGEEYGEIGRAHV